jgi:hypothetical protein
MSGVRNTSSLNPIPPFGLSIPRQGSERRGLPFVLHVVEAVLTNRMPAPVVELDTISAAINFVKWSINQARILYADLGLTEHQDSNLILRFVERFANQGWIDTYRVRSWYPVRQKPSVAECRAFMRKLVHLGYAASNGKLHKEYQIIIHNSHFRQSSQTLSGSEFELRPPSSILVKPSATSQDRGELTNFDATMTAVKPALAEASTTLTKKPHIDIYVGDKVRYVGRGEWGLFTVKGIWRNELTVEAIQDDRAVVSCPQWVTKQTIPLKDLRKV